MSFLTPQFTFFGGCFLAKCFLIASTDPFNFVVYLQSCAKHNERQEGRGGAGQAERMVPKQLHETTSPSISRQSSIPDSSSSTKPRPLPTLVSASTYFFSSDIDGSLKNGDPFEKMLRRPARKPSRENQEREREEETEKEKGES